MRADIQDSIDKSKRSMRFISKEESLRYKQLYETFKKLFTQDQTLPPAQKIKLQYVVSTDFLVSWKLFCTSVADYRLAPLQIYASLYDQMRTLRIDMKQKCDYQLLSLKTYTLLKEFHSGDYIRRSAISNGVQLRPSCRPHNSYIIISSEELKQIEQSSKQREDFNLLISNNLLDLMAKQFVQNVLSQNGLSEYYEGRLWKVDQSQDLDSLFEYLEEAANLNIYQSSIQGFGQRMNPQQYLYDIEQQVGFFIVEIKRRYQKWFMFAQSQTKCEGCKDILELRLSCLWCESVSYCSRECLENDKRFHSRFCRHRQPENYNNIVRKAINKQQSDCEQQLNQHIQPVPILSQKNQAKMSSQIRNKFQQSKSKLKTFLETTIQQLQTMVSESLLKIETMEQENRNTLIRFTLQSQKLMMEQIKNQGIIRTELQEELYTLQRKIAQLQCQLEDRQELYQQRVLQLWAKIDEKDQSIGYWEYQCRESEQQNQILKDKLTIFQQQHQKEERRNREIAQSLKISKQFYELLCRNQIRQEIIDLLSRQEVYTYEQLSSCSQCLLATVGIPLGQVLKLKKL